MKSIRTVCSAAGIILLSAVTACAAPTGGTRCPLRGETLQGLEANVLAERRMKNRGGAMRSTNYFTTFSYGMTDWLSIDLKAGIGDVVLKQRSSYDYALPFNFAGGYGFRLRPRLTLPWGLVAVTGFQHISVHPSAKNVDDTKYEAILDDWQWSFLLGKSVRRGVSVYAGAKVSQCFLIERVNEHRDRTASADHYGLLCGMDIALGDLGRFSGVGMNIEARFLDEEAVTAGVQFGF